MHAAGVGDRIFGIAAGRGPHHPITGLETGDLAADRFNLARALKTEPGPHAADAAVLMPGGDHQIGAIEARSAHADEHLVRLRIRLWEIADLDPLLAQDCGFHCWLPRSSFDLSAHQRPQSFT